MQDRIWKYVLQAETTQAVMIPWQSQILCVAAQGEDVCLWALVNPSLQVEPRVIEVYGTGHEMKSAPLHKSRRYIGTAHLSNGLVFHVFESK